MIAIAAALFVFMRRRKTKAASPPDYPHEEVSPGPHELEPKDVPVKDAHIHKFSAQRTEGPPAGNPAKVSLGGAQELEQKDTQVHAVSPQSPQDSPSHLGKDRRPPPQELEPRDTQVHETFVQPGELEEGNTQRWELNGGMRWRLTVEVRPRSSIFIVHSFLHSSQLVEF